MSASQERKYNYIFEQLAGEPDDLVGLLAYGIYKREKIAFIKGYRDKHGSGPSEEELSKFHDVSMNRLESYRQLAATSLEEFQNMLVETTLQELSDKYELRFRRELRKTRPSWKAAILQSFAGSVLFTFFIGVLVVILIGWRSGMNTIVREAVKLFTGQ